MTGTVKVQCGELFYEVAPAKVRHCCCCMRLPGPHHLGRGVRNCWRGPTGLSVTTSADMAVRRRLCAPRRRVRDLLAELTPDARRPLTGRTDGARLRARAPRDGRGTRPRVTRHERDDFRGPSIVERHARLQGAAVAERCVGRRMVPARVGGWAETPAGRREPSGTRAAAADRDGKPAETGGRARDEPRARGDEAGRRAAKTCSGGGLALLSFIAAGTS